MNIDIIDEINNICLNALKNKDFKIFNKEISYINFLQKNISHLPSNTKILYIKLIEKNELNKKINKILNQITTENIESKNLELINFISDNNLRENKEIIDISKNIACITILLNILKDIEKDDIIKINKIKEIIKKNYGCKYFNFV